MMHTRVVSLLIDWAERAPSRHWQLLMDKGKLLLRLQDERRNIRHDHEMSPQKVNQTQSDVLADEAEKGISLMAKY